MSHDSISPAFVVLPRANDHPESMLPVREKGRHRIHFASADFSAEATDAVQGLQVGLRTATSIQHKPSGVHFRGPGNTRRVDSPPWDDRTQINLDEVASDSELARYCSLLCGSCRRLKARALHPCSLEGGINPSPCSRTVQSRRGEAAASDNLASGLHLRIGSQLHNRFRPAA